PNREVKPARADGTAVTRGRVGRCQPLQEPVSDKLTGFFCARNAGMARAGKANGMGQALSGGLLLGDVHRSLHSKTSPFSWSGDYL
uniref:hypothetical protein n=1 Tax=Pararcticibacter amylolyticus TaxID=2173175 RepID=UPI001EE4954C